MTKLHTNVLGAVGMIYAFRRLTSAYALRMYVTLLSFVSLALLVSIPHVTENFLRAESSGLPTLSTFIVAAVTNTSSIVQIALLLGTLSIGWLLSDFVRTLQFRRFA